MDEKCFDLLVDILMMRKDYYKKRHELTGDSDALSRAVAYESALTMVEYAKEGDYGALSQFDYL